MLCGTSSSLQIQPEQSLVMVLIIQITRSTKIKHQHFLLDILSSTHSAQELKRSSDCLILCSLLRRTNTPADNLALNCMKFDQVSLNKV